MFTRVLYTYYTCIGPKISASLSNDARGHNADSIIESKVIYYLEQCGLRSLNKTWSLVFSTSFFNKYAVINCLGLYDRVLHCECPYTPRWISIRISRGEKNTVATSLFDSSLLCMRYAATVSPDVTYVRHECTFKRRPCLVSNFFLFLVL